MAPIYIPSESRYPPSCTAVYITAFFICEGHRNVGANDHR